MSGIVVSCAEMEVVRANDIALRIEARIPVMRAVCFLCILFGGCSRPRTPVVHDLIELTYDAEEISSPAFQLREVIPADNWTKVSVSDDPTRSAKWTTELFLDGDPIERDLQLLRDGSPIAFTDSSGGRRLPCWTIEREGTRYGPLGLEVNLALAGVKKVPIPPIGDRARVHILACGTPLEGKFPMLRLAVNGQEACRLVVDATTRIWCETALSFPAEPSVLEMSIANDWCGDHPFCGNIMIFQLDVDVPHRIAFFSSPGIPDATRSLTFQYRPVSPMFSLRQDNPPFLRGDTRRAGDPGYLVMQGVGAEDETRPALFVPLPSRIVYALTVPEEAVLEFSVAARPGSGSEWGRGTVRWSFRSPGGETEILFEEFFHPDASPSQRCWVPAKVSLARLAGKTGVLVLETTAYPPESRHKQSPTAEFIAGMCIGCPRVSGFARGREIPDKPRPDVIIISIDTLRSDHVSCYGYHRNTTPNIDRVAEQSVLFEECYSTSSWTLPAHASLFTSAMPSSHGLLSGANALGCNADRLASWFGELGYRTGAFVDGVHMRARFGLSCGFDVYRDRHEGIGKILPHAISWWNSQPSGFPRLLFLHCYDVHDPYGDAEEFRLMFHPNKDYDRFPFLFDSSDIGDLMEGIRTGTLEIYPEDIEHLKSLYDGDIYYTDGQLGILFDHLREREEWEDVLMVILSDHGEEFMEHGTFQHGNNVYEETARVPLLIKFPGGRFAGERTKKIVSLIDLLPTMADLLEEPIADTWEGKSLLPLISRAAENSEESVFVEHYVLMNRTLMKKITPDYSLIVGFDDLGAVVATELYDREVDRTEQVDVSEREPEMVRRWTRELEQRQHSFQQLRAGALEADLDAETREQLRRMGYLR